MSSLKQFVVYKLSIDEKSYIGSTCNFRKRLRRHKNDCFDKNSHNYNTRLYKYIRENNLDFDDIEHEILEEIKNIFDNDKDNTSNARIREQYYIDIERENNGSNILNYINAYVSEQEWKERKAAWEQNNREKNRENDKERKAAWYQNNKERINKKINCECGGKTTVYNKARHNKTKIHQDYLLSLEK